MEFFEEIKKTVQITKNVPLKDIIISSKNIEKLKTTVFDYWERNVDKTIKNIKKSTGLKAYIWGGESPSEPLKITTKLLLSGFDKIIFLDQLSHLFFRDNMISTKSILDIPALYVYKKDFLITAVKQYLNVLSVLDPLIKSGIVQILPPPNIWDRNISYLLEKAVEIDAENPEYFKYFEKGIEYELGGKVIKLNYKDVKALFDRFNLLTKNEKYIKKEFRTSEEYLNSMMLGPSAELNEALIAKSFLAPEKRPHDVSLITDIKRHWDWLEWKLGQDLITERKLFRFEKVNIPLIDEIQPEALIEAKNLDMLDDIRKFLKNELILIEQSESGSGNREILKIEWDRKYRDYNEKLKKLKKDCLKKFVLKVVFVNVAIGIPHFLSIPEWLSKQLVTFIGGSFSGGFTLGNIINSYDSYKADKKNILKEFPLYIFLKECSKNKSVNFDLDMLIIDKTIKN